MVPGMVWYVAARSVSAPSIRGCRFVSLPGPRLDDERHLIGIPNDRPSQCNVDKYVQQCSVQE